MSVEKDKILITLSLNQSFRPKLKKLLYFNADVLFLWNTANHSDFINAGLTSKDYDNFCEIKRKGLAQREFEIFREEGIKLLYINDDDYPNLLRNIKDAPPFLFIKGNIHIENPLAVVGARKPTRYGANVASLITERISRAGIEIVSGLAIGIDTLAHKAAITGGSRTIAVLGSGVNKDSIYPRINWLLAEKILEKGGAIISEYPPCYPLHKMNFPERNRIISGLSRGVLIIEARAKSGALITADFALEQGKDVFAIPHDINRAESVGTNNLIKEGAVPVTLAEDILDYWGIERDQDRPIKGDSPNEDKIIEILSEGPLNVDQISRISNLTIEETSATLSLMEIKGIAVNQGAQIFSIKK